MINQDNGSENHSRRTQFIHRIVAFAHQSHLDLQLAYYPPYHGKYNPVERTFGLQQLQIQILTTGADLLEDERNLTEEIGWKQSR